MNYILKIDCPDEKGLVHKLSGVLYGKGLNMIENEEYVDKDSSHFFMRTEVIGDLNPSEVYNELNDLLPETAHIQLHEKRLKDIVVFATKEYHCLGDLLIRHHFGDLNARILAVISNHNILQDFTEKFEIPFYHVPTKDLQRAEHEEKVRGIIQGYNPEFLVLAKYMRIFTPAFTRYYENRIINIHHSFLPAFIGAKPYAQAHQRGVKMIGATAHFVNDSLDEGPIITQDVVHTNHKNDARMMARLGRDVEKFVLAKALKLVLDDRVFVFNNKTVVLD